MSGSEMRLEILVENLNFIKAFFPSHSGVDSVSCNFRKVFFRSHSGAGFVSCASARALAAIAACNLWKEAVFCESVD